MLGEIIKYRDLLFMLAMRDIRIRYKQAIMGFAWAIFMPIMAIMAGVIVKLAMSFVSGKPLDLQGITSITVKVLPWTFFVSAIKFSVNSLVSNRTLITKIYFPRETLPFGAILASLFDFFIALCSLSILLAIARVGISMHILLVPFLLIFFILFTTGLGLILSSANLFYRDVKYIVDTILMLGIFFTPVFYSSATFGRWQALLLINPIGSILEAINDSVVLHQMPDILWLSYAGLSSILIFLLGVRFFRRLEPQFAERI